MVKNIFIIILIFIISLNIYSQENLPAYPPKNPEIISTNDIKIGMEGVGYTVVEGTNIQPFKVKVLSEGKTIIVEAEGLNLEQSGIAVGMNGSPVYFDNKLAGAIYLDSNWEFNKDSTAMLKPINSMHKLYDYSYYSYTNITSSKKMFIKTLLFLPLILKVNILKNMLIISIYCSLLMSMVVFLILISTINFFQAILYLLHLWTEI